jgi:hypothetical protein
LLTGLEIHGLTQGFGQGKLKLAGQGRRGHFTKPLSIWIL